MLQKIFEIRKIKKNLPRDSIVTVGRRHICQVPLLGHSTKEAFADCHYSGTRQRRLLPSVGRGTRQTVTFAECPTNLHWANVQALGIYAFSRSENPMLSPSSYHQENSFQFRSHLCLSSVPLFYVFSVHLKNICICLFSST